MKIFAIGIVAIISVMFQAPLVSAFTLDQKNAILDDFVKIDKPIESAFDKCRNNFDVVKNNDTTLSNACMNFVSHYNNHMKQLINETKSNMIEILVNN